MNSSCCILFDSVVDVCLMLFGDSGCFQFPRTLFKTSVNIKALSTLSALGQSGFLET
jgi:hypothetical protein